jgi:voltage-gated sodium channel
MQTEVAKVEAEERAAEREIIHEETEPLVREIRELKAEVMALRRDVGANIEGRTG